MNVTAIIVLTNGRSMPNMRQDDDEIDRRQKRVQRRNPDLREHDIAKSLAQYPGAAGQRRRQGPGFARRFRRLIAISPPITMPTMMWTSRTPTSRPTS